ncbi:MAG: family 16 glycoside hydrolase [Verrucomicrobiota bacterium]
MYKAIVTLILAVWTVSAVGAETVFDFSLFATNTCPSNFVSKVTGEGQPGEWKIVEDEIPQALAPLTPNAPKIGKRKVLAQLSTSTKDEHFPLLILGDETYGDFTFSTRFKCVSGSVEQMAGIAFRIQDETNYYVVRASSLGNSFRFYKFVNGERSAPIGPEISVEKNVWQEMSVQCKGNQIHCLLNGQEVIPMLTDNSFARGQIGYWTKSDSVSYFADGKVVFTSNVVLAQKVVNDMMDSYPRLIGLKIFAVNNANELRVVASNVPSQVGEPAAKAEKDVLTHSTPYIAKSKKNVSIIMPLKDRNGDTVAVLRVLLKPFFGQTERNILGRALPVVRAMEGRIVSAKDLLE